MARTVPEWIAKHDDQKVPDRVRCSMEGCDGKPKGHGLCNKHLKRLRVHGDPNIKLVADGGNERKSRDENYTVGWFLDRSLPEPNSGCWIWMGAMQRNDYGAVRVGKRTTRAHRLSYQVANAVTLGREKDVCHRCDVRQCVNPAHLFEGTRKQNMEDCASKGRIVLPMLVAEECPASKLTADQVRAIRKDTRSQRELGRIYGVDKGTIAGIKKGKTWRSVI